MCGIFGYFDQGFGLIKKETFLKMGKVIEHRGPDGQGTYLNEDLGVGLGNQRLAILDVKHGDQPFCSADESVVVVQNGEIFNHVELSKQLTQDGFVCETHCDTEVILRLYERDGIEGISLLNGMFSIAIFDKNIDSIFLVRDRVGEKPLHYHMSNKQLVFGSEIKSILEIIKPKINFKALKQYLAFNYVPMPETMFEGIKHVKPGHYLKITRSTIDEVKWWDLSSIKVKVNVSEEEWISRFDAILDDAVRIRLRSDVPFGAFLSGGVDSSSVVGLMAKHITLPVKTYCIGFDDPRYDESSFAQEASDRFKTDHHLEIVDPNLLSHWPMTTYHCDQPHGDVSFLPTYRVSKLAASDVKMVLTGDGADELFAGYSKYKDFFSKEFNNQCSEEEFESLYAKNIELFSAEEIDQLLNESVKEKLSSENECLSKVNHLLREVPELDRINKALYIDTQLLLSGNNLVKPDRMGMSVSIENRAPFLDYRMIELAFSMPGSLKLKQNETKYIYKKAVSSLIGKKLAYRKKQMFTVPVGEWFKSSLLYLCEDLLLSARSRNRGFFNYDMIKKILDEHCSDIKNNTREIRALMAFEYWCREFID